VAIEAERGVIRSGGSSTEPGDLFMNDHALQSLLSDKFKIGADASVAPGRWAGMPAADTDVKLKAEDLSYFARQRRFRWGEPGTAPWCKPTK